MKIGKICFDQFYATIKRKTQFLIALFRSILYNCKAAERICTESVGACGRGGMADAPDLGSGVFDVRVQVSSSAPTFAGVTQR